MYKKRNEEKMEEEKDGRKEGETSSGYEFLKETIKEKPIDKRKLAKHAGRLAGSGALFGLAAAVVFGLAAPGIRHQVESEYEEQDIRYPESKNAEQETGDSQDEETVLQETQVQAADPAAESIQELNLDDIQRLYTEMFQIAETAKKSMVTVIGSKNDKDWFQTPYESQISGLIVAESEQDLYILTEYRIVEDVDRIQVVFCDGTVTDGRFQKADQNTGLAILKIPKSQITAETKNEIRIASLGDSYLLGEGEPVLAIGSPMGYSDSVGYGIVTSSTSTVSKVDAEYGLLITDITGSSNGSGVLINLEGEIVGIIAQSFAKEDLGSLITGLAVSQSRELIETLTNNEEIVYMGITGENISSDISEKKGIPQGVFVKAVEVDSPAMQVGIQNGDVIIEINGEAVDTVKAYQQQLKSCRAGDTIKVKAMRQGTQGYVEVSFDVTLKAK